MNEEAPELCLHCKRAIYYGKAYYDEWAHVSGSLYCLTDSGYTATPIRAAQPIFHPKDAVL